MALNDHIEALHRSIKENTLNYKLMMEAVEGLTNPEEIQAYFKAFITETEEVLARDLKEGGNEGMGIELVMNGVSLEDAASYMAKGHFSCVLSRYELGHYASPRVRNSWKAAVPSLYPNNELLNLAGFYQKSQLI